MRWGLIPSWATDRNIGARTINARSETVASKPSFRGPLQKSAVSFLRMGSTNGNVLQAGSSHSVLKSGAVRFSRSLGLWDS